MGLPVYVFNCSEQMNVQSLGTIFKGLAQTGAWGCFDEFNRIPIEVLSVVSTQVGCILNGVREKRSEFDFMGEVIKLVPSVGMFITMNPGYAGRTELPENLKALFRSLRHGGARHEPHLREHADERGLHTGAAAGQEVHHALLAQSSELLSPSRSHYDWGLRATKAVLRIAGGMKRAEPKVDEDRILMRALRDSNLAKLVDDDKPIFRELINDLFPGLGGTERKVDAEAAGRHSRSARKQRGLQAEETFVFKCLELAELLAIRHSVFVIGPAGCGKSGGVEDAATPRTRRWGARAMYEVINPKAIRNNELYGWLSKTDWHDGVLSTVMRNMSPQPPAVHGGPGGQVGRAGRRHRPQLDREHWYRPHCTRDNTAQRSALTATLRRARPYHHYRIRVADLAGLHVLCAAVVWCVCVCVCGCVEHCDGRQQDADAGESNERIPLSAPACA